MKRLVLVVFVALAVSASLPAQQGSFLSFDRTAQPSFLAPAARAADSTGAFVPWLAISPVPSAALPEAPRAPQFGRGGDIGYRWDLAVGYEYVHFESAPFSSEIAEEPRRRPLIAWSRGLPKGVGAHLDGRPYVE